MLNLNQESDQNGIPRPPNAPSSPLAPAPKSVALYITWARAYSPGGSKEALPGRRRFGQGQQTQSLSKPRPGHRLAAFSGRVLISRSALTAAQAASNPITKGQNQEVSNRRIQSGFPEQLCLETEQGVHELKALGDAEAQGPTLVCSPS